PRRTGGGGALTRTGGHPHVQALGEGGDAAHQSSVSFGQRGERRARQFFLQPNPQARAVGGRRCHETNPARNGPAIASTHRLPKQQSPTTLSPVAARKSRAHPSRKCQLRNKSPRRCVRSPDLRRVVVV